MASRAENRKPALRAHWVSGHERAATRETLIEVARLLVERDGEPALTLGAVADEAGLARATVYGFFAGRRELLDAIDPSKTVVPLHPFEAPAEEAEAAIWTDGEPDLTAFLAEAEPVAEEASPESEPEPERVEPIAAEPPHLEAEETVAPVEPEDVLAPAAAEPPHADAALEEAAGPAEPEDSAAAAEQPDAAPEETAASDPADDIAAPPEPAIELQPTAEEELAAQDERRRVQATHLEEIAKRLILPESALKDGTDAVISRLDTRIKVLEKSIVGLETRQNAMEDGDERKLGALSDSLARVQARIGENDSKQLQALSELRLSVHELENRVDALETSTHGEAAAVAPAWPEPEAVFETPAPVAPEAASGPEADGDDEARGADPRYAYLSQARTLAREGARQAEERESLHEAERQSRRRSMIIAACIAVACLVVVGLLFRFNPGGGHGVSVAQSRVSSATGPAAQAPLDRLTALAEKGDAEAELLVGLKYLAKNDTLAARWLDRSAHAGNALAENALGALYQHGRGVKTDLAEAERLYQASAAQGNRHAMANLAILYAGASDKPNFAAAALWFQRSAALGYVDAQFNLAVLYERGDGVPQSLLDAYKWYAIAGRAGDAVARTRAEAIATQLSGDELQAAQKAAAEFKPEAVNLAANDVPKMAKVLGR